MPKYKLIVPHTMPGSGAYLEAGTLVGDDTPYPWVDSKGNPIPPSIGMEGVDEESQQTINEHYDEEVLNDPNLPKLQRENTMEEATKDMTQNAPNPNVSPPRTPPAQTRNESTVPPLRKGPVGAVPAGAARPPQSGATGVRNPLDLGASKPGPDRSGSNEE